MKEQEVLDNIISGFGENLARFSPKYKLQTQEYATFGEFGKLFFSFEHFLEIEDSVISFYVSSRVKSLKSDEILCKAIGIDKPDLNFRAFDEYALRSFPFSFKDTEFDNMKELREFALDDMPEESYHSFLQGYQSSINALTQAFKIDVSSEIQGLYDFIYKFEANADTFWQDRTLMQILLLIELNQKDAAMKLIKSDNRDEDEREIFVEYDDGTMEIFEILHSALKRGEI